MDAATLNMRRFLFGFRGMAPLRRYAIRISCSRAGSVIVGPHSEAGVLILPVGWREPSPNDRYPLG